MQNHFHLSSLRRILKLGWQDRIPDTEVPERTGILRICNLPWRGPATWVLANRESKKRCYKDTLKKSLKQLQINPTTWEDLAQARPVCKRSTKTGSAIYEANRIAASKAKMAACNAQALRIKWPMSKPCHCAHAVNAHSARESAWSDIFELNATTAPKYKPLPHLPQTPCPRPPQRLIETSSMPRRPRSLKKSSLFHPLSLTNNTCPTPTTSVATFDYMCCAVRAEQRCGPLDTRAVDGLDGFEKVFHFIEVRIPLDFLSLSDHPGVLHLPQPLLYKAAASEEGHFGGVSPKDADVGLIVVIPVLVLTACASEDFEGGGLDDISQLSPSFRHGGIMIWSMQVLEFLGYLVAEIKTHVLSISPPDENIVQQLSAPRPRVHPRGLLPRWKAEKGVGQQETVFRKRSQKKEAVIVTATETVGTQPSLPGSVVCSDLGFEAAKDNHLIRLRHCRQQDVQVLVEFVLHRISARYGEGVGRCSW
ncbi:unnamed protein product [Schistocephalus solidus]|uniref:Reverse transcriptase domain-containing protein n=1 Tax=Schistocephalus solidus TaxID=70667 RepID=A0A183TJ85_SCHSO|nr:unnamed protein product [Schistocephalus solidus]